MKSLLVVLFSLALSAPVHAFNEPDSFMGIKFWRELGESIPQCKRSRSEHEADRRICFYPEENGSHKLKYVDLGFGLLSFVDAYTVDNKFAKLNISFGTTYYPTVVAIFKERYDKPTKVLAVPWTNRLGGSVPNEVLLWEGQKISIVISQRSDRVDMTSLTYETDIWRDRAAKESTDWIKNKAKGL
jgi:hypothetical protein